MYGLDLFSGIGGITKALRGYVVPVAYCERDRYAIGVLLSRMHSGDLPTAPIWDDVLTLHGAMLPHIEIIYGGFPCQDISIAGRGAGLGGKRSRLFFEIVRLVSEIRPRFIFLENVPTIRARGAAIITAQLSRLGYDCRHDVISARECGSPIEEGWRWFLLAKAMRGRRKKAAFVPDKFQERSRVPRTQRKEIGIVLEPDSSGRVFCYPSDCPDRTVDGLPIRVEQAKALGNAVVPSQAREAFKRLMGL